MRKAEYRFVMEAAKSTTRDSKEGPWGRREPALCLPPFLLLEAFRSAEIRSRAESIHWVVLSLTPRERSLP